MLRFYQAEDELEAQMLIDFLQASHIRATLLGRYQSGAAGELSALNFPWVWLMEKRDEARARELLADFRQQRESGTQGTDWVCTACGTEIEAQFDLCWHCGAERPL